jgi:hypothetical protein
VKRKRPAPTSKHQRNSKHQAPKLPPGNVRVTFARTLALSPGEPENYLLLLDMMDCLGISPKLSRKKEQAAIAAMANKCLCDVRSFSLSPGERAGVRVGTKPFCCHRDYG